jgi:hypothetical protein
MAVVLAATTTASASAPLLLRILDAPGEVTAVQVRIRWMRPLEVVGPPGGMDCAWELEIASRARWPSWAAREYS